MQKQKTKFYDLRLIDYSVNELFCVTLQLNYKLFAHHILPKPDKQNLSKFILIMHKF